MPALIECVPNFSEGRDPELIRRITDRIQSVEGATLLHVDPGVATNRTVVTFAGAPEPVLEAAFQAIRAAAELIDMRNHHGAHPRMGATDVCPLVPLSGITLAETAVFVPAPGGSARLLLEARSSGCAIADPAGLAEWMVLLVRLFICGSFA